MDELKRKRWRRGRLGVSTSLWADKLKVLLFLPMVLILLVQPGTTSNTKTAFTISCLSLSHPPSSTKICLAPRPVATKHVCCEPRLEECAKKKNKRHKKDLLAQPHSVSSCPAAHPPTTLPVSLLVPPPPPHLKCSATSPPLPSTPSFSRHVSWGEASSRGGCASNVNVASLLPCSPKIKANAASFPGPSPPPSLPLRFIFTCSSWCRDVGKTVRVRTDDATRPKMHIQHVRQLQHRQSWAGAYILFLVKHAV